MKSKSPITNLFSLPEFGYHKVTAWFMSGNAFPKFSQYEFSNIKPDVVLYDTHVPVTEFYLPRADLLQGYLQKCERAYEKLSSSDWTNSATAAAICAELNLKHIAISTGDIIQVHNKFFLVKCVGFEDISHLIQQ